jgi:hypothetical protein
MKMMQHERMGARVVQQYEVDTLGAPFKVRLWDCVSLGVDPKTGEEKVHIPDLVGLISRPSVSCTLRRVAPHCTHRVDVALARYRAASTSRRTGTIWTSFKSASGGILCRADYISGRALVLLRSCVVSWDLEFFTPIPGNR